MALCFDDYIFGIHFLDITGYGYIGPVCFEEYIFTPNAASHPHLRFTLISAFLRRLHTATLQPPAGVPVHGRILFPVSAEEL